MSDQDNSIMDKIYKGEQLTAEEQAEYYKSYMSFATRTRQGYGEDELEILGVPAVGTPAFSLDEAETIRVPGHEHASYVRIRATNGREVILSNWGIHDSKDLDVSESALREDPNGRWNQNGFLSFDELFCLLDLLRDGAAPAATQICRA